jgi:hypothetical protein
MQSDDREAFKAELTKLCAGFEVPYSKGREEAYWAGLGKMSLGQFKRCVQHALSEDYPEEAFPKVGQIWRIHKGAAPPKSNAPALPPEQDHLEYYANRLFFLHMTHRGGFGSIGGKAAPELAACLAFKRDIVEEFAEHIRNGDPLATPAEFVHWWRVGLRKCGPVMPRTEINLQQVIDDPASQVPFAVYMGRETAAYLEPA